MKKNNYFIFVKIERAKEKQGEEVHQATELIKPADEIIKINFKKTAPIFKVPEDNNVPKTSKSDENEIICMKSEPQDQDTKEFITDDLKAVKKNEEKKKFVDIKPDIKDKKVEKTAEKRKLSTLEEILVVI